VKPVLVVGEDVGFRRFVRIALRQAGFAAQESGVQEAVRLVGEAGAVVYDCPLGDGGEGFRSSLSDLGLSNLPVVWVTSGLSEAPRNAPALVKPFDPLELVARLQALCGVQAS
jgi:DNA-binding response OmpR family regulator